LNPFSYLEYTKIIHNVLCNHPYLDFRDVNEETTRFVLIRHDVEFSPERAIRMALLEHCLGIQTSYFFQLRNAAYNLFSERVLEIIRSIYEMGHSIGLHVHLKMLKSLNDLPDFILQDVCLMSKIVGVPVDRFSYHRPSKEVLKLNLHINGLINTYDRLYFDFKDNDDFTNVNVKYFADSMHRWKYGYPDEISLSKNPKVQLLLHPDEWSPEGGEEEKNFRALEIEKCLEFQQILISECKHYCHKTDEKGAS
jgi:hypothetical protein